MFRRKVRIDLFQTRTTVSLSLITVSVFHMSIPTFSFTEIKTNLAKTNTWLHFFSTNYLYQVLKINLAGPQLSRIIFNFECFISWFKTLRHRILTYSFFCDIILQRQWVSKMTSRWFTSEPRTSILSVSFQL